MSLVFKINILALTRCLFSINASALIWHFCSSGRLFSCDNMQFQWHYLLMACDSAPDTACSCFYLNNAMKMDDKGIEYQERTYFPAPYRGCDTTTARGMLCCRVCWVGTSMLSLSWWSRLLNAYQLLLEPWLAYAGPSMTIFWKALNQSEHTKISPTTLECSTMVTQPGRPDFHQETLLQTDELLVTTRWFQKCHGSVFLSFSG